MKTFLTIPSLVLLCLGGNLPAQKPSDYTGLWELGGKQRRYAAALILRQDGNRYPNFFSGERKSGDLTILSEPDLLGDAFTLHSKGGIQCVFTRMAPKPGMELKVPGGTLGGNLKNAPLDVTIEGFAGWEILKGAKDPTLTAKTVGFVSIHGKKARMEGVTTFRFDDKSPKWTMASKCTFQGKDLGLPASQHGDIHLQLFTNSPVSKQTPGFPSTELKFK
tara:strand:- start:362 stop:1021 length:660 start_codon:yes stop_codon:yes gene_type:complete